MGIHIIGLEGNRRIVAGKRLLQSVHFIQSNGATEMGFGVSRLKNYRLPGAFERLVETFELGQQYAEIVVTFCTIRLGGNELAVLLNGILKPAELRQRARAIVDGIDMPRIELEDTLVLLQCSVVISNQVHGECKIVPGVNDMRLQPDRASKHLNRRRQGPLLRVEHGKEIDGIEIVRM